MLVETKQITEHTGQRLMEQLLKDPTFSPLQHVKSQNLQKVSEKVQLTLWCEQVVKDNPKAVKDYLAGEEKSLQFLVGNVMKLSKGTAEAKKVGEILKTMISAI